LGTTEAGTQFRITYSDGKTDTLTVPNGKDGQDGRDVSIDDLYEKYVREHGDVSYAEFLDEYFSESISVDSNAVIGKCLLSSLKVYSTFVTASSPNYWGWGSSSKTYSLGYSQGSAVIYKIDGDDTYIVTNYHVVYSSKADETANGGYLAKDIYCYLYGSESEPVTTEEKDATYGYALYDFGEYGVRCEYMGGSVTADLAVLKANTDDLTAINDAIREVSLAEGYTVGESAVAIGNTEGEGISVTKGIVSVDNEYIALSVDGNGRYYRCLRIDTSIYSGNSGGGLFNQYGELIGITNAGNTEDQNINYAIPIEIVRGTVDNILYYYLDGNETTNGAYKILLGITVSSQNAKYVYDTANGNGKITENVIVEAVTADSIAQKIGILTGDTITGLSIDGTDYPVFRSFDISDLLYRVREGSTIGIAYTRNGEEQTSELYTVLASDLSAVE
ncbi:MAG: S1C family serine protease, partial [Clostridia bacterium]|nr:S1C family serine protease [Clostridia bacterium]